MNYLKLELKHVTPFLKTDVASLQTRISELHNSLHQRTGQGSDFLGWLNLPVDYDQTEFNEIRKAAKKIQAQSDVLVVVGIGGSYLGAKAGLHMLSPIFAKQKTEIVFAGHHLSADYHAQLFSYLKDKDFSVNIISKSGTTTEPAISFRFLKKLLVEKYGEQEAAQRIYATTDKERGALFKMAQQNNYQRFIISDNIGGRFSVLTAVGLLPFAVAGLDIAQIMKGAQAAYDKYLKPELTENEAYLYAAHRYLLYKQGFKIELLANYEPGLVYLNEWWKQLFGESEGKENKGLFPASASYTTDLHSIGQYVQEGERHLFETIIQVLESNEDLQVAKASDQTDGLADLEKMNVSYINHQALKGTMIAHVSGGVPNLLIQIPKLDAYAFGYLVYFFEKACAMSAYLLGLNPFDQPGVEAYKKEMFKLLGIKR
ncbi:MAG: glucose-6-phosphate isomerase [Acholeplasmataceae bacterium]